MQASCVEGILQLINMTQDPVIDPVENKKVCFQTTSKL